MWLILLFSGSVISVFAQKPVLIESEAFEEGLHSFPKDFSFGASTAGGSVFFFFFEFS